MVAVEIRRQPDETRGRPRVRGDDEILAAALEAFAACGYDAMSVRALSRSLGLSNGAINQRFRSKHDLYLAAVDHGFASLLVEIDDHLDRGPSPAGDLEQLRAMTRAFLLASVRHPELVRLMNLEGLEASDRLDHIATRWIKPAFAPAAAALQRLRLTGTVRPITDRAFFFLLTHGAAAPYTLTALSGAFDAADGPLDPTSHAETVAVTLIAGLLSEGDATAGTA